MKTRRILQQLQASASNSNVLVGSPKVVKTTEKVVKCTGESFKVPKAVDKENIVRRSKRKAAKENDLKKTIKEPDVEKSKVAKATEKENFRKSKRKSPVESELKTSRELKKSNVQSFKTKTRVVCSTPASDTLKTVTLNQSRIETFLTSVSDLSKSDVTQLNIGNITVNKSEVECMYLITSDSPSRTYWQDIAEQRRIACEKASLENELLTDQVNVLQVENSLLKNALDAAEKVLKMSGLLE